MAWQNYRLAKIAFSARVNTDKQRPLPRAMISGIPYFIVDTCVSSSSLLAISVLMRSGFAVTTMIESKAWLIQKHGNFSLIYLAISQQYPMLAHYHQYVRFFVQTISPTRRSFTRMRQLKDLEQIYELLKTETACKFSVKHTRKTLLHSSLSRRNRIGNDGSARHLSQQWVGSTADQSLWFWFR